MKVHLGQRGPLLGFGMAALILWIGIGCAKNENNNAPDSGTDTNTNDNGDTDTDVDADSDTDTVSDTDSDAQGDTDTDSGTDLDTGSGTDLDTDSGPNLDAGSDTDTEVDAGPGSKICDEDGSQITDDAGITWVTICGSAFKMGSTQYKNEEPVHEVTLQTFEMAKSETTVAQYAACVDVGECTAPSEYHATCNWNEAGFENHPVNCVDWYQAHTYCAWLGARLPSEAEWEYAARSSGQDVAYSWGNQDPDCSRAMYLVEGVNGCGTTRTAPVCDKPLGNTEQGLCNMAGNVREWVQDLYHDTYKDAPVDGGAWEVPDGYTGRVGRGGALDLGVLSMRCSARAWGEPDAQRANLGFRCARQKLP